MVFQGRQAILAVENKSKLKDEEIGKEKRVKVRDYLAAENRYK